MVFENELRWPGIIGQLFVLIVFVSSILSAITYFISAQSKNEIIQISWKKVSRMLFGVQAISVLGIVITLYYIIHEHRFEYHYAWEHSSMQLPMQYLLACFWEGQEGSFLLWMFWNMVLGAFLIFRAGNKWEAPVLSIFMVVQCFLSSMLLGIYFWDYKVGSTPFSLLREVMVGAPIFQRVDYLSFIKDGNGLNPLLQNYWMVIHPPILFLGFASTLVPFAYAMAALWKKDYSGWIDSVTPWTLFSGAILGTGIMMGGAWAYESLTFGGYWAWDPVENASLVPWLILVGGIHTMLAYKKTGHSLRSTFLFYLLSFILVLYSTFLTRSGILGNSSVHAFTDLGMSGHLVFYLIALAVPAIILLILNWKKIPAPVKEEAMGSREFWIFVGAGILFISAFQITLYTSIPVYKGLIHSLTGVEIAPPTEPIQTYNSYQLPVAVLILLLSSLALYLKFRKSEMKLFYRRMIVISIITIIATAIIAWKGNLNYPTYLALLFASLFSIIANMYYMFTILKGKHRLYGPALAHLGFGIFMLGVLISSANKHTISLNYRGVDYGERMNNLELHTNQFMPKNSRERMGNYFATYIGDSTSEPNHYYKVLFELIDTTSNEVKEKFVLHPNAQINPKMGLISNPATRHYWDRDVYTHVTTVPEKNNDAKIEEEKFTEHQIAKGDTIFTSKSYVILESVEKVDKTDKAKLVEGDLCVGAKLHVYPMDGNDYVAEPLYLIQGGVATPINDKVEELGLIFRLTKILPDQNKVQIDIAEVKPEQDYIVMKAIVFPFINLVWLGIILCVAGFLISLLRIFQKKKPAIKNVESV